MGATVMAATEGETPVGPRREGEDSTRDRGRDSETEKKTVRFPKSMVEHVEGLVEDDEYASFSGAVRDQCPDEWFAGDMP